MNTPVLFLLGAVALSALGGMAVWIASRPRPEKFGSSIDTFTRDLDALAPPGSQSASRPARPSPVAGANGAAPRTRPSTSLPTPASARPKPGPRPQSRS